MVIFFQFTSKTIVAFAITVGIWSIITESLYATRQSAAISPKNWTVKREADDPSDSRTSLIVTGKFTFPRVVEGEDAEDGEFPFMVSIQYHSSWWPWCGGTLLTTKMVLSAGHCFFG